MMAWAGDVRVMAVKALKCIVDGGQLSSQLRAWLWAHTTNGPATFWEDHRTAAANFRSLNRRLDRGGVVVYTVAPSPERGNREGQGRQGRDGLHGGVVRW